MKQQGIPRVASARAMDEITFHLHLNARHPWLKLEADPSADEETLMRLHAKDHKLYRERFPDGAGHPHVHKHVRAVS